jgi:hypothetical protein
MIRIILKYLSNAMIAICSVNSNDTCNFKVHSNDLMTITCIYFLITWVSILNTLFYILKVYIFDSLDFILFSSCLKILQNIGGSFSRRWDLKRRKKRQKLLTEFVNKETKLILETVFKLSCPKRFERTEPICLSRLGFVSSTSMGSSPDSSSIWKEC